MHPKVVSLGQRFCSARNRRQLFSVYRSSLVVLQPGRVGRVAAARGEPPAQTRHRRSVPLIDLSIAREMTLICDPIKLVVKPLRTSFDSDL